MAKAVISLLLVLLFLIFFSSGSAAAGRPHEIHSFKPRQLQAGGECSYEVTIKTSCFSPSSTGDRISIAFGDISLNEVYVREVEGKFERCSVKRFTLEGPCMYGLCFLYVYRQGAEGWAPEWVTVYDRAAGATYTFDYADYAQSLIPADVWIGFDGCPLPPKPKLQNHQLHNSAASAGDGDHAQA